MYVQIAFVDGTYRLARAWHDVDFSVVYLSLFFLSWKVIRECLRRADSAFMAPSKDEYSDGEDYDDFESDSSSDSDEKEQNLDRKEHHSTRDSQTSSPLPDYSSDEFDGSSSEGSSDDSDYELETSSTNLVETNKVAAAMERRESVDVVERSQSQQSRRSLTREYIYVPVLCLSRPEHLRSIQTAVNFCIAFPFSFITLL